MNDQRSAPDDQSEVERRTARELDLLVRARRHRRRRGRWAIALAAVVVLLVAVLWLLRTRVPAGFESKAPIASAGPLAPLHVYELYFGGSQAGDVQRELRYLPRHGVIEEDVRLVITALCEGSQEGGLSPWPRETVVQDLFVSDEGVIFVNFGSSLRWRCPHGDYMEWLVAASLSRTLCANFPDLTGVRILIDGESTGPLVRNIPLEWTYRAAMFGGGR